ncbi:MAG: hypothetical protein M0R74_08955 [Dehalococcoidia bacterium]|nr:hypothetical protein [Dehalococcoidia bacterium]
MTHVRLPKRIRLPHEAYKQGDTVFHVAIRAMPGQRPFHGDRGERVWQLLMNERERPAMVLLAACLMPDHLHAILRPGERSVIRWRMPSSPMAPG